MRPPPIKDIPAHPIALAPAHSDCSLRSPAFGAPRRQGRGGEAFADGRLVCVCVCLCARVHEDSHSTLHLLAGTYSG